MPIVDIKHVTTYRYNRPVSFGKHRMMLFPREDGDQKVLVYKLEITPKPLRLNWSRDIFGNHVSIAQFGEHADELRFVSRVRLNHTPTKYRASDIDRSARRYPFAYTAKDLAAIAQYIRPPSARPKLDRWSAALLRNNNSIDLYELLVRMTQTIKQTIKHVSRHEEGTQKPERTLSLGSGSCRDVAVLMIAVLRSRGIAARFVSGYVRLVDDYEDGGEADDDIAGGNTHAWVQVYLPGPGWVDFDPTAGVTENQNLIRVAAVRHPREAIPLQGTWYGSPSDHLAMNVGIRVRTIDSLTAKAVHPRTFR